MNIWCVYIFIFIVILGVDRIWTLQLKSSLNRKNIFENPMYSIIFTSYSWTYSGWFSKTGTPRSQSSSYLSVSWRSSCAQASPRWMSSPDQWLWRLQGGSGKMNGSAVYMYCVSWYVCIYIQICTYAWWYHLSICLSVCLSIYVSIQIQKQHTCIKNTYMIGERSG